MSPRLRMSVVALVGLCSFGLSSACGEKKRANVAVAPGEGASAQSGPAAKPIPAQPVATIKVFGSMHGVDDQLEALGEIAKRWAPPSPMGGPPPVPRIFLENMIGASGYGPGFLSALDLAGAHAIETVYPAPGQGPAASAHGLDLVAVVSTRNSQSVIDNFPASYGVQPVGNDTFEMKMEGDNRASLVMRAKAGSLEIGRNPADLDRGPELLDKAKSGARLHVRAWDIPPEADVGDLRNELGMLADVLPELTALEVDADLGMNRDLVVEGSATAPFGRLGIEPIGAPITAQAALTQLMPAGAASAVLLSYGNPKLLHERIDKTLPRIIEQVPPPFDTALSEGTAAVHEILDSVQDEVLSGVYLDAKGDLAVVVAAKTKGEAPTQSATRKLLAAAHVALKKQAGASAGDFAFKVQYKEKGAALGSVKADVFSVTIPKGLAESDALEDDLLPVYLLGGLYLDKNRKKPKIELLTFAKDDVAFVAVGPGAKGVMKQIAANTQKAPAKTLETDGGQAMARRATDGCQLCVSIEPNAWVRLLLLLAAHSTDPEVQQRGKAGLSRLAKMHVDGQLAAGVRVSATEGSAGVILPKELLFAQESKVLELREVLATVFEAL